MNRLIVPFSTLTLLFSAVTIAFAEDATKSSQAVVLGTDSLFAGIPGTGPLTPKDLGVWLSQPNIHTPLEFSLPKGLDLGKENIFVPQGNPITRGKIELGRQLYFDKRLSSDSTISCASCHNPDEGYGAATRFGVGVGGAEGGRNSPVAYNRILSQAQFWDGRAATLEDQAVGPIANPIEMGNTHEACVECLAGIPGYKTQFEAIFKDGLTIANVGKAIATFERAIVTGPAPYDFYAPLVNFEKSFDADTIADDEELFEKHEELKKAAAEHPMSDSAKRGMELTFGKANCTACHAGANFADELYHNLGVGMDAEKPDLGRFEVTKEDKDRGAFKTPTMRNAALSPPYMHDGSQKTLEEVVEWYNKGGHPNQWLSEKVKPLKLSPQEVADVVAFMREGLTGSFPNIERERLPE